jgi:hypothetical protein
MGKYLVSIMQAVLSSDDLENEGSLVLRLEGMLVCAQLIE